MTSVTSCPLSGNGPDFRGSVTILLELIREERAMFEYMDFIQLAQGNLQWQVFLKHSDE
jgi:hypothetical protein